MSIRRIHALIRKAKLHICIGPDILYLTLHRITEHRYVMSTL